MQSCSEMQTCTASVGHPIVRKEIQVKNIFFFPFQNIIPTYTVHNKKRNVCVYILIKEYASL